MLFTKPFQGMFLLLIFLHVKIVQTLKMKKLILWCFVIVACNTMVFAGARYYSNSDNPIPLSQAKGFMQNRSIGFEENKGQVTGDDANRVKFTLKDGNLSLFLLNDGIAYQFNRIHYPEGYSNANLNESVEQQQKRIDLSKDIRIETYRMDVQLVGANPNPRITTDGESKDYVQYYTHNVLNVHNYSKVTYHDIYPNIDWVIYTIGGQTKYDFVVHPGGEPNQIKLKTNWVEDLKLNADGSLSLKNRMGEITEKSPVSFQDGVEIMTRFEFSENYISFHVDNFSKDKRLTIDPSIIWSTYYGGPLNDEIRSVDVSSSGNIYCLGVTVSTTDIAAGGYQSSLGGNMDAYVVKFNSSGLRQWASYYGGANYEDPYSCSVDGIENVYFCGYTTSTTGISSSGFQNVKGGGDDAFLIKFDSNGFRLWGTYYGGGLTDLGYSCATDISGNVYLAGTTGTGNGMAFSGYQNASGGAGDGYLVKFDSDGNRIWATYYGGAGSEDVYYCQTDNLQNVYITGKTASSSGISLAGHQNTFGGGLDDAFIVKFDAAGVRQWASYYGGTNTDEGKSCSIDINGNVYLSGSTTSSSNISFNGHQTGVGGGQSDAFLVKFNSSGVRQWGTYYGGNGTSGSGSDYGLSCYADINGNVYLAGKTSSSANISFEGYDLTYGGNNDAFVVKFNSNGMRLWGSYFGDTQEDEGYYCTGDENGSIYLVGRTTSPTNIAFNGYQNSQSGSRDGFLMKIDGSCSLPSVPSGSSDQYFCTGATVSNLIASGSNIQWHDQSTGGTVLNSISLLVDGGIYYASQTNACGNESLRLPVTAHITLCENSLHFDGVNDVVSLPSAINSNITTSGTIEAWIKTTNAGSSFRGIVVREGYYGIFLNNNQLMTYNWTTSGTVGASTYTGASLNDNQWHHVAFTFQIGVTNGSQMYLDGQPVGTPITLFTLTQIRDFKIGNNGTLNQYYQGNIDKVRIWGRGLSTQEIFNSYTCGVMDDSNLSASFNFNNGHPEQNNTGISTLTDESGLNNNGSLVNFGLIGNNSNWVYGYSCVTDLCPAPIGNQTQTICAGETVAQLVATGQNISWYTTPSGGTPLPSNTIVTTGTYYATQTNSDCESQNRLAVNATIPSLLNAPIGNNSQAFCNLATISELVVSGSNILWYNVPSGGTPLSTGLLLTNGSVYYATQTNSCGEESVDRLAVTVDLCENSLHFDGVNDGVSLPSSLNQLSGTPGTIEAWIKTSNAGAGYRAIVVRPGMHGIFLNNNQLTYYNYGANNGVGVGVTYGPLLNDNKWHHVAATFQNGAPNAAQLYLDGQPIGDPFTPNMSSANNNNCIGFNSTSSSQTFTGNIDDVKIYSRILSASELLDSYYCNPVAATGLLASYNFNQGVAGGTNTTVTTLLNETGSNNGSLLNMSLTGATSNWVAGRICSVCPPPAGPWSQSFCGSATIANLSAIGSNIQWYAAASGGTPLNSSTVLNNNTNYYATQTVGACESIDRLVVLVNIGTVTPSAPTGSTTQYFCSGGAVGSLTATGTNITWYTDPTGGSPLPLSTILNTSIYYASQTVNGCESTNRLAVNVLTSCESALHFDGTDRVDLPTSTHSGITTAGTIEAWIKTSNAGTGFRGIVVRSNYYGLFLVDNKLSTYVWGGGAPVGVTTYNGALLNDNQWHHVALSFQIGVANGTQMYLDGQAVGPAITLTTLSTANNFQIGCNASTQLFVGNMDDVKIWSRALAPEEINNSYNCISNGTTNLNGTYRFNDGAPNQNNAGLVTLNDASGLSNNGTLVNFSLTGTTSNWVSGYTCTPNLCPVPTGSANQSFCSGSTVGNLVANGQNISWYSVSTGGTALNTTTPLVNGTIYYATQTTANCESSTRLAVTVTLNALPSAPTGSGSQTTCIGTVANITATGSNIQWYDVPTGGTPLSSSTLLINGVTYYASQSISGCESTDRLAVVVTTETPPPTGNASQEICTGGGTVTVNSLSATGSNTKWYANPSGGTFLPSNTPLVNGTTYYASQTINGCESINRLAVTVILHNFTTNVTAANPQSFCTGATIADLVANITPGAQLNWYTTSTGWAFGTPLPTSTVLNNNTTYYAGQSLGSTNQCVYAGSFGVTVSLNSTSTPTGSATQTFCNSATVANLSATGTAIQWYTTSTGGTALSSGTSLTNGTTYYASQTVSGCESASRLEVTVTINTPSVPTGMATQTFCSGATVGLLSANGTNIQWYNTSTGGSPIQTTTVLQDGLIYYASQTIDGCESVGRLEVTAAFGIPSAPTGLAIQTFCNSATVANLLASGSNIQWYANPTGGTTLLNSAPLSNGSTYYATQTSGGCESTDRLAVNVTINAPAAPTGNTLQEFCNSATVASLAATGTDVQWYTSSTGGTALSAGTVISNATTYYASQTISGCESAIRMEVAVTINTPAAPTGNTTQSFCGSATLADLTATGTTLLWYDAASAGNTLSTSLNVSSGATYYVSQTINGCESNDRLGVQVTINSIPSAPTGSAAQSFCNAGTVSDLTALGSNIQWYATSTGGTALSAGTAFTNGLAYYASQTSGACESTDRLEVTVTINSPSAPTGSATQEFCNTGTVAELITAGSDIQWYTSSTGGSALGSTVVLTNGIYYASQTISGCESADRFAVAVTINIPAAPAGNTNQNFCGSALVSDIAISGSNITWYDAASAGNVLLPTTALVDGSTYYANQTISGCESLNQLEVTVSVNAIPSAPTGAATQEFCNGATIAELAVTGTALTWYASAISSAPLSSSTSMSNGTTYFATQTLNGCESSDRLEVTVTINAPVAPSGNPTQTFCSAATVNDLNATGTDVAWYSTATGGTPLASSAALSNGTYYASQTVNGCESSDRLEAAVTINAPVAPSGNPTQTFCSAATVNDLNATGTDVAWYSTATGGTPLASSAALSNGTYYASQTINGCESANRLAVAVTVTILNSNVTQSGITLTATQSGANYTWVDCNNGNQPIAGASGQSYTPTANGSYAVEIDLNGCSAMSSCVQITSVGLEEDKVEMLNIQPNPTSGMLIITVSEPTNAVVTASNGAIITTLKLEGETVLDATKYATGVYYLRTSEGQTVKFIKE